MRNILLIIDPQVVYFDQIPVVNGQDTLKNIERLAESFPGETVLVTHELPGTPFEPASASCKVAGDLENIIYDHHIIKGFASAFTKTPLAEILGDDPYEQRIFICGYQSHHCILATALEAAAYGEVCVVDDACSSPDLINPMLGTTIPGSMVHNVGMATVAQIYCTVVSTAEVLTIAQD